MEVLRLNEKFQRGLEDIRAWLRPVALGDFCIVSIFISLLIYFYSLSNRRIVENCTVVLRSK